MSSVTRTHFTFDHKRQESLIDKYDIAPTQIIGHADLAPGRKIDPGSMFPWQKLAENGIGLWYDKTEKNNFSL